MNKKHFPIIAKILLFIFIVALLSSFIFEITVRAYSIPDNSQNILENILKNNEGVLGEVIKNPEKYQVQILYTQIDRDKSNKLSFNSFKYKVDKEKYFYPASAVKLSACALALEKLNDLGIDKNASVIIEKGRETQKIAHTDNTLGGNPPTIANYIKKVLVASDNDGFDRLYEFLGQEYYNETLWKKGYKDVLITHRLGNYMSLEENRYTNPMKFYDNNKLVYSQAMVYNSKQYKNKISDTKKGKGYKNKGRYINEPKDFSKSNYFSLECLQEVLKAIMFPKAVDNTKKFNLKEDDYEFLKKYMSVFPKQCDNPKYSLEDNYGKYFVMGDNKEKNLYENLKIYNKIGKAYGYIIDNAYIVDESKNIEFLITSVIYCNKNEIFNDEKYEYDTVGIPFLASLGREIYKYELNQRKL